MIKTTHVGSLPRPSHVADLLLDRENGQPSDRASFGHEIAAAVRQIIATQIEVGIDIPSDGEMSKISYSTYVKDRMTGFDGDTPRKPALDLAPYDNLRSRMAAANGGAQSFKRQRCVGPIEYTGHEDLHADIKAMSSALTASDHPVGFINAASPGLITAFQPDAYFGDHGAYLDAVGEAIRTEYEAIAEAGLQVQIDCPDLAMARHTGFQALSEVEFLQRVEMHVDALNYATRNLAPEQMRMHVCWGNYEGPHDCDIDLERILPSVLRARPATILFESANPRHAHEWQVWANAAKAGQIPDNKILAPGVITSTSNYVDHPEHVAQILRRFVEMVGPDRVLAATDCGFGTFAGIGRIDPDVVWKKLSSLAQGAELARRAS